MPGANRTLVEIAGRLGAELVGDGATVISGLGSLKSATDGQLSHLSSPSYRPLLEATQASALILKPEDRALWPGAALVVDNPYLAFARVSQMFAVADDLPEGVHPCACIDDSATVHPQARVGAHTVIGAETSLAAGVRVYPNTVVGERCVLAEDVVLRAHVTLYNDVRIGARSILHSGAVIGADGFGFTPDEQGHWETIAQLGGVDIGADVSVGAASCIDCGALDSTVIEEGVKIDNHVQIGHNCRIGAHSLLCGMVGFAGSSTIGKHCVFAGRSGAGGDQPVDICDGVMVTAGTIITQSVTRPGVYSGGVLFHEHSAWRRNALRFMALDTLFKRVKKLESQGANQNTK